MTAASDVPVRARRCPLCREEIPFNVDVTLITARFPHGLTAPRLAHSGCVLNAKRVKPAKPPREYSRTADGIALLMFGLLAVSGVAVVLALLLLLAGLAAEVVRAIAAAVGS